MKRDTIERLAIDSAAGQLNEDAEALLRTYLAEHPQANQWAEDMLQVYKKTEAAINAKIKTADVGIEGVAVKVKPLSQVSWRPVARWAAVMVLGTLIGFVGGRWSETGQTHKVTIAKAATGRTEIKTLLDLKKKYAGTFWGDKILASVQSRPYPKRTEYKRNENFWPNFRQYIKEKNYE